jgi:hypothetical protein
VTVHIVRNWTWHSPRLISHLRTLRELCETLGVTISTRHLPSVLNLWADRLSRRRDSTAWVCHTRPLSCCNSVARRSCSTERVLPTPRAGAIGRPALVLPRPALCRCGTVISLASVADFLSLQPGAGRPGSRPPCAARASLPSSRQPRSLAVRNLRLWPASLDATRAWQSTGLTLAESVLGTGPVVATSAVLLGQALAPTTSASYQRLWVLLERFCTSAELCALPATPATVCAYLGTLFVGGACAGRPYAPMLLPLAPKNAACPSKTPRPTLL